jgi:membrane protease YdiL (CAAX protease family)
MTHPPSKSNDKAVGIRGIVAFLALTFAWSWGIWGPKVLLEQGLVEGGPVLPNLGAFGPTVAAFILVAYANGVGGVRRLAGRAIQLDYPKRWILVALLLPPTIVGGALAVAMATGTTPTFPWAGQPIILVIAFVWIFLLGGPIQEEFGWRGYLLDPLQERLTPLGGALAVGFVWAVWHLPLFYIPSETIYYANPFLGFAVSITLLSVLMTWVYNSTNRSLLPALLMHTSWNWAQGMFPVLDSDPASLAMVGLLVAATIVVVVYSGRKRLGRTREVAQPD